MKTCCFTGHRPDKLGGYNYNSIKNLEIKRNLKNACRNLIINEKVSKFVFGGALGFDQMAFEVVYELKQEFNYLILVIAIPFKLQDSNWIQQSKDYYHNQLKLADEIIYVDTLDNYKIKGYEVDKYYPAKMQKRNEYMVDVSNYIITYFDGSKGGTANCLNYWNKKKENKPINIF